jgi:NADH:ubiquinone oxidoreductase subunit 5 (subunit L)/multisubunit Na+/H+ antiporter MnhA subunit
MIALVLLLPLFIALIAMALINDKRAGIIRYIPFFASLASLLLIPFISSGESSLSWFSIAGHTFSITTVDSPINALLLLIVFSMASIIFVYSFGFMDALSEQKRFYMEMTAFEIAMAGFAMSGNFIMLFISWEFLSLTSYLLIGFWHSRESASRAARKTVTIIMIGDIALISAIVIFYTIFGSLNFITILTSISSVPALYHNSFLIGVFLLIVAIFTKSAQFPFQEWLPDAMEGPTPVSAFLHSTTMVKAGVFATLALLPLFIDTGYSNILLYFGILTAAIATLNASRELHVKRVIAYSTIQELSLMIVAISSGAILAGIYFFIIQSFYKALLFFSSGVMMKATDDEDLNKITGLRENKLLYFSTLFGALSLAGFFPFAGFFSSISLTSTFSLSENFIIYLILSLISIGTSFYIFRWLLLASKDPTDSKVKIRYKTAPKSMILTTALLAVLSLASSAIFFIMRRIPPPITLSRSYLVGTLPLGIPTSEGVLETALILIGLGISLQLYSKTKRSQPMVIYDWIVHSTLLFNKIYEYTAAFVYYLAEGIAIFDLYLSDSFDYLGHLSYSIAERLRYIAVGDTNLYVLIFSIGILFTTGCIYIIVIK